MQALKKAIPAALALAFAGAAQAQVTVYGLIDMNYGKNEFVSTTEKAKLHSGGDNGGDGGDYGNSTTRFGIKGSSDAGSGVKMNFNLQSAAINSDGAQGSPRLFGRAMWLGASGGFGEVRAGRQDSVPFQVMGDFDFNGQSNGSTSAWSGVSVWGTGRQSRSIQYMTPKMGGFTGQLGYTVAGGDDPATLATEEKNVVSAAGKFALGDLLVGAAYESKHTGASTDKAFKSVAASYDLKVVKLMAGYAAGPTVYSVSPKSKGYVVGAVAPIAGFSVGTHYAKDRENDKDAVLELFVNKEVAKNTYAYIEGAKRSSDVSAKDGNQDYAIGVIYVF
jgi:predicted porin